MSESIPHHKLQPGDILRWQCPKFPANVHRWRVLGVHLGAVGQESLIECESVTHGPGHAHAVPFQYVYIPEVLVRALIIEDIGEQFGLSSPRRGAPWPRSGRGCGTAEGWG